MGENPSRIFLEKLPIHARCSLIVISIIHISSVKDAHGRASSVGMSRARAGESLLALQTRFVPWLRLVRRQIAEAEQRQREFEEAKGRRG